MTRRTGRSRAWSRVALGGALLLLAGGWAAPTAGATPCPDDTLVEVFDATCVLECGSFFPLGVPAASYCYSNNGRCPGLIDRAPDVEPYYQTCARDDSQACDPPPALVRLAMCNQT